MMGHRSGWVPDWIERTMVVGFRQTAEVSVGEPTEPSRVFSQTVAVPAGHPAEFGLIHLAHASQRRVNCLSVLRGASVASPYPYLCAVTSGKRSPRGASSA